MNMKAFFSSDEDLHSSFAENDQLTASFESCSEVLIRDYNILENHPQINHVVLLGDLSGGDLHLQDQMEEISNIELQNLLK